MIKQVKYALQTDRGIFLSLKKNAIIVGDPSGYTEFQTKAEVQDYVKQRKITVLNKKLKDKDGKLDEAKVAEHYIKYCKNLDAIAIPFEEGIELKTNNPKPVKFGDTLNECIQGHKTKADKTPPLAPELFKEIKTPVDKGVSTI